MVKYNLGDVGETKSNRSFYSRTSQSLGGVTMHRESNAAKKQATFPDDGPLLAQSISLQ